jgi:transposase InsO family protein
VAPRPDPRPPERRDWPGPSDNTLAGAFNATLKRETLAGAAVFPDEASCRREIFRWAVRYNTRRRHSYCGHLSPNTYENHLAATLPEAA